MLCVPDITALTFFSAHRLYNYNSFAFCGSQGKTALIFCVERELTAVQYGDSKRLTVQRQ